MLQSRIEKIEGEIRELSQNSANLKSDYGNLTELLAVLEKSAGFFQQQDDMDFPGNALLGEEGGASRGHLGFVAGVIERERVPGFERMLWRVSRGNVFLKRVELEEPIEDPVTVRPFFPILLFFM